jgi:cytochrome oxidase Cu insertion factor (SCO1/SenC/PrrC family)
MSHAVPANLIHGLNEINIVLNELGDLADKVQVFFITVDPERDSEERLKEYIPNFNSAFIGLTSSVEEVRKVADLYDAVFVKRPPDENGDYTVRHSTATYVVDHEGIHVDMLPLKTPIDDFKRIFREHIENAIDASKL